MHVYVALAEEEWESVILYVERSGEMEKMIWNKKLALKEFDFSALELTQIRGLYSVVENKISTSDKQQKQICSSSECKRIAPVKSSESWLPEWVIFGGEEINWVRFLQAGLSSKDWPHVLTAVFQMCQLLLISSYKFKLTVDIASFQVFGVEYHLLNDAVLGTWSVAGDQLFGDLFERTFQPLPLPLSLFHSPAQKILWAFYRYKWSLNHSFISRNVILYACHQWQSKGISINFSYISKTKFFSSHQKHLKQEMHVMVLYTEHELKMNSLQCRQTFKHRIGKHHVQSSQQNDGLNAQKVAFSSLSSPSIV